MTESPLKILYVEDEPDIRMVGKRAMTSIGKFEVQECSSGPEALITALKFTPDVIILDVMMPYMTGPETLKELKRFPNTANAPVIFMTAKVQAEEIKDYMDLGAIGVIAKPFEPMTLAKEITDLLTKHKEKNK